VVVNSATSRAAKPHVLSRSDFASLARGCGSAQFVEFLWNAQRSRRLLLIKALLDNVERRPDLLGPLPGADAAWSVLSQAHQLQPASLDQVLRHPQVGTALSFALRRLAATSAPAASGSGSGSDAGPPLWVDFGQIHVLALVVAARAGLTWRTAVPLRAGRVMLPGLGLIDVSGLMDVSGLIDVSGAGEADRCPGSPGFDWAIAGTEGGRIWLEHHTGAVEVPADPSQDGPHWLGLRRVAVGGQPELTVWLDDLDPFRDFSDPVPPARLTERELSTWQRTLAAAWRIVCDDQPELASALAAGVASLVPLPAAYGWDNRSASTGEAFGSVMVSPPSDATALALSLVHEFQHIKLGGLMHLVTLTGSDDTAVLYAPWRDDPRPLAGLAQGAYAFLGIATFWRSHRKNLTGPAAELAAFEYAYAREQTREAVGILRGAAVLTPLGREFLELMHEHVESWLDDEIPPNVMDLVRMVADGHRAGWRIRHLRPGQAEVSTLVSAWIDGTPPPAPGVSTVVTHPDHNWSQGRLGLVRRWLLAPDELGEVLVRASWAARLTASDVAVVAGRYDVAIEGFVRQLDERPADLDAWTGLALALRATGATPASTALLGRPELVVAVERAIRAAGQVAAPLELVSWLGSGSVPLHNGPSERVG